VEGLDALPWDAEVLLAAAGVLSLATLAGAAALLPRVVARLPEDHFVRSRTERRAARRAWAPTRVLAVVLRNVLGAALLVAGVVMLFVPGQGLLTILVALLVMDFPGKFRLEQALVRRAPVLRVLNRLRARAGRPPLEAPDGARL
jgi:hypothetical protein